MGFEIELLAPVGRSRKDLAAALAEDVGGGIRRCFYPQSEPSLVPNTPVFHNLVLGYDAYDREGRRYARCVDDLTLQADLDRNAAAKYGWYRIVSDDSRLLRLIMAQCNPEADLTTVLCPVAALFGTELTQEDANVLRLADQTRAPIALVTTLPGERERPCELITEPIVDNHEEHLAALLATARKLDFTVPKEAAVHIHFDGSDLWAPTTFQRLIEVIRRYGRDLRTIVATNPNCRRLGNLPEKLFELTQQSDFASLSWKAAQAQLKELSLSKFVDFNVLNLVHDVPEKPTFEVRILPGSMDAAQIVDQAMLFEAILKWCVAPRRATLGGGGIAGFLAQLPAPEERKRNWIARVR